MMPGCAPMPCPPPRPNHHHPHHQGPWHHQGGYVPYGNGMMQEPYHGSGQPMYEQEPTEPMTMNAYGQMIPMPRYQQPEQLNQYKEQDDYED